MYSLPPFTKEPFLIAVRDRLGWVKIVEDHPYGVLFYLIRLFDYNHLTALGSTSKSKFGIQHSLFDIEHKKFFIFIHLVSGIKYQASCVLRFTLIKRLCAFARKYCGKNVLDSKGHPSGVLINLIGLFGYNHSTPLGFKTKYSKTI